VVYVSKMGRLNLNPSRVYQTATQILESSQTLLQTPPWYQTIGRIPPGEILTRPQPVQHRYRPQKRQTKKPSKMFKPQPITYEEDRLRKQFFSDHPWELARPRVILEQDGKDGQRCDWSRIEQPGRALNGERYFKLYWLHARENL
jgi:small subunit ribosomal protein S23